MPELTDLRHSLFRQPAFDGPVTARRASVPLVSAAPSSNSGDGKPSNAQYQSSAAQSRLHIINDDDDATSSDDIDHVPFVSVCH